MECQVETNARYAYLMRAFWLRSIHYRAFVQMTNDCIGGSTPRLCLMNVRSSRMSGSAVRLKTYDYRCHTRSFLFYCMLHCNCLKTLCHSILPWVHPQSTVCSSRSGHEYRH